MPRRSRPDPLATANEPRWLVRQTMCRELLSVREIPLGADLHQVMADALTASVADGWQPETDGAWGIFVARRGADRVQVTIHHVPPGTPTVGPTVHRAALRV